VITTSTIATAAVLVAIASNILMFSYVRRLEGERRAFAKKLAAESQRLLLLSRRLAALEIGSSRFS
jgi:hypothetical protein